MKMLRWATVVMACAVLFTFTPSIFADRTLMGTGHTTLVNPCKNETITGPTDFLVVVQTNQTADGADVKVLRNFHASLTGSFGNEYQIQVNAHAEFDALSSQYTFPQEDHIVAKGSGSELSFTASGRVTVSVNANQEPIGYVGTITSVTCGVGSN